MHPDTIGQLGAMHRSDLDREAARNSLAASVAVDRATGHSPVGTHLTAARARLATLLTRRPRALHRPIPGAEQTAD